jgi:hypothetical protein
MYGIHGVLTAGEDDGSEYRDLHYRELWSLGKYAEMKARSARAAKASNAFWVPQPNDGPLYTSLPLIRGSNLKGKCSKREWRKGCSVKGNER